MSSARKIRKFETAGGLKGKCVHSPLEVKDALDEVWKQLQQYKGGLFISNFEASARYARWDIGFIRPPLELVLRGWEVELRALTGEGRRLLQLLVPFLEQHGHLEKQHGDEELWQGRIVTAEGFIREEERSRQPSFLSVLRALWEALRCDEGELGFYGAFGYDLVFQFESLRRRHRRDASQMDACLFLVTDLVTVDRQQDLAWRSVYHFETADGDSYAGGQESERLPATVSRLGGKWSCDHKEREFQQKVEFIRQGCQAGDFFEVVLSQTFSAPCGLQATELFKKLCTSNPSPYSFCLNFGGEQLVGASPEMFVRVKGDLMETSPISGTAPLGDSPMETAAGIKKLMSSDKEESELTMCTDVDRNDMARVCVPGSVRLVGRRLLERYSHLVHTVDHVQGVLQPPYDALDAFATHLWACTTTGAPKPVAMQAIEDLENSPRRWYGGAIGFFGANGDLNTGMTLRTVHLEKGIASVRAGATLLYDSEPQAEERETRTKAAAFLEAVLGDDQMNQQPEAVSSRQRVEVHSRAGENKRVLFVDFLDSFVHTLASYVRRAGAQVDTVRAGFPEALLDELQPDLVFLSPGPGTPKVRGVARVLGYTLERKLPTFGVCLGLQAMAEYFGARLETMPTPMHGKSSHIIHNGQGIFNNLPNPLEAGRYHSLHVPRESLPSCLEVTAHTEDQLVMALKHQDLPLQSVQFHPESILTLKQETGQQLVNNLFTHFLNPLSVKKPLKKSSSA